MSARVSSMLNHVIIALVMAKEFANVPGSGVAAHRRFEEEMVEQDPVESHDEATSQTNQESSDDDFAIVKGLLDDIKPLLNQFENDFPDAFLKHFTEDVTGIEVSVDCKLERGNVRHGVTAALHGFFR
eukprot:TRINITY_DN5075_c2_g1_i5.p1 TRINITY_DN5075_c2_g1~~TRINITY_DN5075_c2_g1_i5.p1  ORF type:complete len:128 (-),score=15.59 TRINITY_DN5075_c2_g1_i5:147-530(-)